MINWIKNKWQKFKRWIIFTIIGVGIVSAAPTVIESPFIPVEKPVRIEKFDDRMITNKDRKAVEKISLEYTTQDIMKILLESRLVEVTPQGKLKINYLITDEE